ncbi:MAG: PLP-dependent aminotransferase family protein [Acetobacteraceae bacterium]
MRDDLAIELDRLMGAPLQVQLYARVREAIEAGTLRAGARLPSARGLSVQLGVARGTVDAAFGRLIGEGYVVPRGPAGTFVASEFAARTAAPRQDVAGLLPAPGQAVVLPFQLGIPALDAFPRTLWSRLIGRAVRGLSPSALAYPDPAGWPPLRAAIAAYLGVSRGVACAPGQVFVTAGYQGALALIARALLRPGDRVWMEDPGYPFARLGLESAGATLIPIRVDRDGLDVAEAARRAQDARFAVVTPSHQSPLGVSLSLARRLALLRWAAAAGAWVIEDDYDSEFHYSASPLPALKSLDREERVLYAGSFSKVLFPGLRLGYLVVPGSLIDAFAREVKPLQGGSAVLEQAAVAAFMAEGYFARHLRRMRGLYAARRGALARELMGGFGDRIHLDLQAGGLHLLLRLAASVSDARVAERAQGEGLAVQPLSLCAMENDSGPGLLLGFTNIAEVEAPRAARRLVRAIGDLL